MKTTKSEARRTFDGSNELFEACWREYSKNEEYFDDTPSVLEMIASEKVNNPKSRFYIYG